MPELVDLRARREAERRLAAEARAVEEGHHTFVNDDGSIRVVSDSEPGVHRTVRFHAVGREILFKCDCPAGRRGRVCKHTALAGRRLEREGLAVWTNGGWLTKATAATYDGDALQDFQP